MTLIVKNVTSLTLGFILLYGIYITLNGHREPGGGFAGVVIIALSFIHLILAFGKDAVFNKWNEQTGLIFASTAALVVLILLTLTFLGAGPRRPAAGFKEFGAGFIPYIDIAATLQPVLPGTL